MSTVIPEQIEGLPTEGPMGTAPTITVGMIVSVVTVVLAFLKSVWQIEPPPEWTPFFDQYGLALAGVAASLITAAITYFRVFAPASVAERYRPKAASSIGPVG